MKKSLLLLFFLSISFAQGQAKELFKLDKESEDYYFENIHQTELDSSKIKDKVTEWIALNFKDSNHVLKLNTADKTIARGLFSISYLSSGHTISSNVSFDLIVSYKQSKYRIQIMSMEVSIPIPGMEDVKTSVYSYAAATGTFEDYKNVIIKAASEVTDKYSKKYYAKTLKDEAGMRAAHETSKALTLSILQKIENRCLSIDTSINNYVLSKSSKKDDW